MKNIIKSIALLSFSMLGAASAVAAPAALPLNVIPGLGVTNWQVTNTGGTTSGEAFSGFCFRTAGLTIEDATSADGNSDAYDFAHSIWVNDVIFAAPASVDLTGNTITAGPVTMSGLEVSVEYAFSDAVQAARIRAIFQNPTNSAIDITVDMPVNSGASPMTIEATSSGDALFDTADRWVVSSDGDPPVDPVNTTVLWGDRAAVTPSSVTTTVFACDGDAGEGIGVSFDLSIPANSTRQLMFFAGLGDIEGSGNTVAGAITNAAMFDIYTNIDPSLLAGLTDTELGEIVNWELRPVKSGGGGPSCSLGPTTASARQAGDLWLLLAFVSGLGLWRVRRMFNQATSG
jgi:hypothetical protein